MHVPTLFRVIRRARYLLRRSAIERERDAERRFHIDMETEDLINGGMRPSDARRAAITAFGRVEQRRQAMNDRPGFRLFVDLKQDLRHAARTFSANVGFSAATVLTIGFGIAATAVTVALVNTVLLKPLPVQDPDNLFVVDERWSSYRNMSFARPVYPFAHYLGFRQATEHVFADVAAFRMEEFSVTANDRPRVLAGALVSGNYFRVLGIRPALGRFFSGHPADSWRDAPEAVLGFDFWRVEFAADSSILGQTLIVNGRPLAVVGVAPRGFHGSTVWLSENIWVPVGAMCQECSSAPSTRVTIFGRLPTGTTPEAAAAALNVLAPDLDTTLPLATVLDFRLDPLRELTRDTRGPLLTFLGMSSMATTLVLLVIATNVAGLLLARALRRRREISIRMAMGASRARVARQLLTETVTLGLIGAIVGVVVSVWGFNLIPSVQLPSMVWEIDFGLSVDTRVLLISASVALAIGVFAGLAPARHAASLNLAARLRQTDLLLPGGKARLRTAFVVTQIAVSAALLATATLFSRAVQQNLNVELGFDATGVGVASVALGSHGYDASRSRVFFEDLVARLQAHPAVAFVGIGRSTPFSNSSNGHTVSPSDHSGSATQAFQVGYSTVDAGYFDATRTTILAGRGFRSDDRQSETPVVIVNENLARRVWLGRSPLGETIGIAGRHREVIGVVRDGKIADLDEPQRAHAFVPISQSRLSKTLVYARGRGSASDALRAIREEVAELDRNVALGSVMPLSEMIGYHILHLRIAAWFIGAFGVVGLALASLGVYGIFAYQVAARTREFGIRLALGAQGTNLVKDVLTRACAIVGLATAVGVLLAMGMARVISGFLFGFGGAEVVVVFGVCILLGLVAVLASYLPARRAAKVDPVVSLRV
jgi:putative ABC transport system permease protein